jgi:hypothetical protein
VATPTLTARLRVMASDAVEAASGRHQRSDAIAPVNGGPAGNAALTAWTGLLLLVLFLAELATLLNVRHLISWHLVIGVLLIPPALLKTATTGWRIVRYYSGSAGYRQAGPPPMVLRVLGPLVVVTTLAVLGSGVALVVIGPGSSRTQLFQALGHRVDAVTIHQVMFVLWAVATGLHVIGRLVPALRLSLARGSTGADRIPGRRLRALTFVAIVVLAAVSGVVVFDAAGSWRTQESHRFDRPPGLQAPRNP